MRMTDPRPTITTFVLGPYQTNCFVVSTPGSEPCWIVDCGFEPGEMFQWILKQGLKPAALLLTHTHLDHIAGVDMALSRFGPVPMFVHEAEAGFASNAMLNLSALIGMPVEVTEPQHLLRDGQRLELNGTQWRVLHTPGHSPGGVCFVHDASRQAIVGDTLFAGSIGRFDFPSSDPARLRHSIGTILMSLPDDTTIHPGHGTSTTVSTERRTNPYVIHGF